MVHSCGWLGKSVAGIVVGMGNTWDRVEGREEGGDADSSQFFA